MTWRARGPLTGQERKAKSSKKVTQPNPSYLPYMSGLSTNPHIHLKYGEDMRARRRTRSIRHLGRDPPPDHNFFLFFLSLNLPQSHASHQIYKGENEKYGCWHRTNRGSNTEAGRPRLLTIRVANLLNPTIDALTDNSNKNVF